MTSIDAGADTRGQIIGDNDAELIGGTAMNDTITGNGGNDDLNGYDGNDTIVGGTGDDIMRGGKGSDTYFLDSAGDQAIETSLAAMTAPSTRCTSPASTISSANCSRT